MLNFLSVMQSNNLSYTQDGTKHQISTPILVLALAPSLTLSLNPNSDPESEP